MSRMSPEITEALLPLFCEGEAVLDVGCGEASLLTALSGRGIRLFGVDPSFACGPLPEVPADVTLLPGRAEALPFADSRFGTVVLQCVFSLCRPAETVREILRVLKPGGRLILSDLFSPSSFSVPTLNSPLLGALCPKAELEDFFSPFFQLLEFRDLTPALKEMIVEAIWAGEGDACVSCGDLSVLRAAKARYGLWLWRKPG